VSDSLASGRPVAVIAPRSKLAAAIARLADEVRVKDAAPDAGDGAPAAKTSRLGRLFGRVR
jgi:MinD-like ATPase involved in chromosome partitioning or flagellar assembly